MNFYRSRRNRIEIILSLPHANAFGKGQSIRLVEIVTSTRITYVRYQKWKSCIYRQLVRRSDVNDLRGLSHPFFAFMSATYVNSKPGRVYTSQERSHENTIRVRIFSRVCVPEMLMKEDERPQDRNISYDLLDRVRYNVRT